MEDKYVFHSEHDETTRADLGIYIDEFKEYNIRYLIKEEVIFNKEESILFISVGENRGKVLRL